MFTTEGVYVTLLPPATTFSPLDGRTYTLTHSDETGELYCTIGCSVYEEAIDPFKRDEVIGEWGRQLGLYQLRIYVHVTNGDYSYEESQERFAIFQKELPRALKAIMKSDYSFFVHCPWLLDAPVVTHFQSTIPRFQQVNEVGRVRDYLV